MEQLFFLFSFLMLTSVMMTITSTNPMHSIFWLVLVFIYSAGFCMAMKFEFMALMILMMYVGAMTVLFLFVMMMLDTIQLKKTGVIDNMIPMLLMVFINMFPSCWWFKDYKSLFSLKENQVDKMVFENYNHITNLATNFYNEYVYHFMIMSVLLMMAMMGTMVLTLETNIMTSKQNLSNQHQSNNSWT